MRTPSSRLSTVPKGPSCGPRTSNLDPTHRVTFTDTSISIFGWPSRGGVIILNDATHVDLQFLGLSTRDPLRKRHLRSPRASSSSRGGPAGDVPGKEEGEDDDDEDTFCQRLLLLGAKWWDSESRYQFVDHFGAGIPAFEDDVQEGRVAEPTLKERRWVKIGWEQATASSTNDVNVNGRRTGGGFWILDCDTNWMGIIEEDNMVPGDGARVLLAASMEERCEVLKQMGASFYPALESYNGESTFLRAWEWKREGEIGPLKKVG